MTASRITHIRFNTSPIRKEPKRGDLRWLKGRKVWQIRQERRVSAGLPGAGTYIVSSNGRLLWEWVDRGSDRDRQWAYTARHGERWMLDTRHIFESGCLCLIEGRMSILPMESNEKAAARYMAECTCSRHPEHGRAQS